MGYGDEQHTFLKEELRAAKAAEKNTFLYMHRPRYSCGRNWGWRESTEENRLPCSAPTCPAMTELWNLAVEEGGDLILAAHTHAYERFEPMKEGGAVDTGGVPSFVVGTGGNGRLYEPGDEYPNDWNGDCGPLRPHSAFYDPAHYGALGLDLRADGFGYAFQATDGTIVDSGAMGVR
jgi:hypothetical protein